MHYTLENSIIRNSKTVCFHPLTGLIPYEFGTSKEEYLACRESAWMGGTLSFIRVYDVFGPDSVKFLNSVCVNRDFGKLQIGKSRHGITVNEKGQILANGLIVRLSEDRFHTYSMAPALEYYVSISELDVYGEYTEENEYFYQIDGPKSLEIIEDACQCDIHDLKFAQNKTVAIAGTEMQVHRLGMSGALAYEVHGAAENADIVFDALKVSLDKFGGKLQGFKNYCTLNHTPGGYPNHSIHFDLPYHASGEDLSKFCERKWRHTKLIGSAADNDQNYYVTPYDIGWGSRVNFDHEFIGKEALMKIAADPPNVPVTLEWNTDDVADVFASQLRGRDVEPYDAIEFPTQQAEGVDGSTRMDYVLDGDDIVGVATGKTIAYYERRMISLAFIKKEYAEEGRELSVLWGCLDSPKKRIRAVVAPYPYYNETRNETFDVNSITKRF